MQVMAGGNDNGVDVGIANYPVLIGSAVSETKFVGCVTRVRTVGSADANHPYTTNPFNRRQERAHGKVARAKNSGCQRFLFGKNLTVLSELNFTDRFRLRRISDQHTEERLARFSSDQIVGIVSAGNREAVRD